MTAVSDQYYVSRDGDVLDQIINAHYGDTAGDKIEAVLSANPGLAALGAVLDAGVRIVLPDLSSETQSETAQLWG